MAALEAPAAAVAPAKLTVIVHYAPPDGDPFRLKLVVPGNKTVGALAKAFAKQVARTRASVPPIDLDDHFLARRDDGQSYLNPARTVADAVADGEAVALVRREPPPPPPEVLEMPTRKAGSSVFRETAYFTSASVGVPNG